MAATRTVALTLTVRPATEIDAPAIAAIYGYHVLHGTGTFETVAPSADEMRQRWADISGRGFPYLVGERGGTVVGFCYANQFRPRAAFRFCVEDSIYIDHSQRGLGVGRQLLAALIAQCEAQGLRKMVAVIGDSANAGSIGLHRALGFEHTGTLEASGWKFERWLDTVYMSRWLGAGNQTAPA